MQRWKDLSILIMLYFFCTACAQFESEHAPIGKLLSKSCSELSLDLKTLNRPGPYKYDPKELNTWFLPKGQVKGVFLIVHGLNSIPSSMNVLAKELTTRNHKVLRVSLNGHRGDIEELIHLSRTDWQDTVYASYCLARREAKSHRVPLYVLGNSLGALMTSEVMISSPKTPLEFKKMVFFAPAITPHFYTHFVKFFRLFGSRFILGSKAPEKYRANKGTSNAAYRALFEASSRVRELGKKNILNLPTLIFLDPDDELVSKRPLKNMLKEKELSQWSIQMVSTKKSTLDDSYHHLIIDEPSVGTDEWKRIMSLMDQFLGE